MGRQGGATGRDLIGRPILDARQKAWAENYHLHGNPTRALREAGYVGKNTTKQWKMLLQRCAYYLEDLQAAALSTRKVTMSKIQDELYSLAFANVLDFITLDPNSGDLRPKSMSELTRAQAASIKDCTLRAMVVKEGKDQKERTIFVLEEVKLHDKNKALVDLGRTIGMFNDARKKPDLPVDPEDGSDDLLRGMSRGQLDELEKIFQSAAAGIAKAKQNSVVATVNASGGGGQGKTSKVDSVVAPAVIAKPSLIPAPRLPQAKE